MREWKREGERNVEIEMRERMRESGSENYSVGQINDGNLSHVW